MKQVQYLALAIGILLVLSGAVVSANAQRKQPTSITLDTPPSVVRSDEIVTFTGMLSDADTGEGIRNKSIVIYREGPIVPIPIAEALTGIDGNFSTTWTARLDTNKDSPVTVFAQFDGDETTMSSRTGKTSFRIALIPIDLEITTDGNKNRYGLGDRALFSVAFHDGMGNFVDPDNMKATYDGNFISLNNIEVGRYTFETPQLVRFEQHQFGVFVDKFGYASAQKSLTITVFGATIPEPVKVTAVKFGDDLKIRVKNHLLSSGDIYTFRGEFIGATLMESSADKWRFSIDTTANSFTFKSIENSLTPGQSSYFNVNTDGTPTQLFWKALGLNGKEIAAGVEAVMIFGSR